MRTILLSKTGFLSASKVLHFLLAISSLLFIWTLFLGTLPKALGDEARFALYHWTGYILIAFILVSPLVLVLLKRYPRSFSFVYLMIAAHWIANAVFWAWLRLSAISVERAHSDILFAISFIVLPVGTAILVVFFQPPFVKQLDYKEMRARAIFFVGVAFVSAVCHWTGTIPYRAYTTHLKAGRVATKKGDLTASTQHFSRAHEAYSEGVNALVARGRSMLWQGMIDNAIQDFELATRVAPQDAVPITYLGLAYYCLGENDRVISNCSNALAQPAVKSPQLYTVRAWARYNKGLYPEAVEDFRMANKLIVDSRKKIKKYSPSPKQSVPSRHILFEGKPNTHTIAHKMLDLEKETGRDVLSDCYDILNATIINAKRSILSVGASSPEGRAIATLWAIGNSIHEMGFSYQISEEGCVFSEQIANRQLNCSGYVFLYLAIAEEQELPLTCAYSPGHVFLRWKVKDGHFLNWEATRNHPLVPIKTPSTQALSNGVWLKGLDKTAITAFAYAELARALLDKEQRGQKAIEYSTLALQINQNDVWALITRGRSYGYLRRYDEALLDFDRAVRLCPDAQYIQDLRNRVLVMIKNGRAEDAHSGGPATPAKSPDP